MRNPVFAIETDPGIFTPVGEVTGPIMVARRDRGEEYLAETTFYYGCRQVAPITNTPPYDSCIWKGVVYHWNISRTHQYEIYRSWRTFSNPAQAADDARAWAATTQAWYFATEPIAEEAPK